VTSGRLARCTLQPSSCPAPGVPTNGPLLAVHRPAAPQAGAPFQLFFTAEPNELVGVFASLGLATSTFSELEQPVALDLGTVIALDLLVADGLGQATGTWNVPAGTANLSLWLQGVTPNAPPLQLSTVTGGVIR
jgi:hypothetical protein